MSTDPLLDASPLAIAETFAGIGRAITAEAVTADALTAVTTIAARVIPGATWVSVSRGTGTRFTTMASNAPRAVELDLIQYELGTGPCIQAVVDDTVVESDDLAHDDRWGEFGPRAAGLGAHAVLSLRLTDQVGDRPNIGLNIYGDRQGAFADGRSRVLGTLFAAQADTAVTAVIYRDQASHLVHALETNREIGVAMGVLMTTHKLTREQSFDLLRVASQNSNRKMYDLATQVADTGALDLPR